MNKIKVIDLLNMISKREEVPKKIKVNKIIFEYQGDDYLYKDEDKKEYWLFSAGYTDKFEWLDSALNTEVEILEEEKRIPEKICTNRIINTRDILEFEMIQNKINAEYTHAINSIIDYLKSKGE